MMLLLAYLTAALDLSIIAPLTDHRDDLGVSFKQIACGAQLAAQHINARNPAVIENMDTLVASHMMVNYTLYDSEMSKSTAIRAYRDARSDGSHVRRRPRAPAKPWCNAAARARPL